MNTIKSLLVLVLLCLTTAPSFAQTCTGTISCIADQHIKNPATDWHPIDPAIPGIFSNNNGPTSPPLSQSLYLWTERSGVDYEDIDGNGAFTCFTFEKDKTYRVCFWVRENSNMDVYGGPDVFKIVDAHLIISAEQDVPYTSQLIDATFDDTRDSNGYQGRSRWEFISTTFTARDNFNRLRLAAVPDAMYPALYDLVLQRFAVEVDDIRITEEASPVSISFSDSKNPISGCGDSTGITINGMPPGARATWTPAVTTPNPTGNTVFAKPCNTTTYKIEITDTNSNCGDCIRQTLYHTVNVETWGDPARIIYPATIACTDTIRLEYVPDPSDPCPGVTNYVWIEPDGQTPHPGIKVNTVANAARSGEWTLAIQNSTKGCAEELKFNINVGSCCISNPDFKVSMINNCSPVTFTNTSTGITNHVSTLWSFDDGTTSSQESPVHDYAAAGIYMVCLTMLYEDGQGEGCCNQVCMPVNVMCLDPNFCRASADFNYTSVPGMGNTFDFSDISSGSGTACQYEWDFGDYTSMTTTVPVIQHFYSMPGPWTVCLKVKYCIDSAGILKDTCSNRKCRVVPPVPAKMAQSPQNQSPEAQPGLKIYPNPSSGNFSLRLNDRTGSYRVIVRDKLRRIVYNSRHEFSNAPVKIILNNISDGIYSVEVSDNKEQFVQQVTVLR